MHLVVSRHHRLGHVLVVAAFLVRIDAGKNNREGNLRIVGGSPADHGFVDQFCIGRLSGLGIVVESLGRPGLGRDRWLDILQGVSRPPTVCAVDNLVEPLLDDG